MILGPHQKMMLGILIGDAYGAGYEFAFVRLKDYQNNVLDKYSKSHYPDSDHFPGMYTDDSQMSIAVAELLVSDKEFSRQNLADKFVECYKRDPIKGYAQRFQRFLDSINSGSEFLDNIRPNSVRNGAAMRAVPIGLVEDISQVVEYAIINAQPTHNTQKGIASSVSVALMSHLNFYYQSISDFEKIAIPYIKNIDDETAKYLIAISRMQEFDPVLIFGEVDADKGVPCDGMRTAGAVFYLLSRFTEPRELLQNTVRLGGDVDSVASISLGINLMHKSIDSLPSFLYDGLTNHKYGRDYVLSLGSMLEKRFPLLSISNSKL